MATENRILKQNKIPGCERLTRPEEIKALSKYLRNIRETLEENTDLEETSLEIPGKTTGQIHDINKLPESYEKLDSPSNVNSLDITRLDIEDTREQVLSDYKDRLRDTREINLSSFKENLEVNDSTQSLSDYQEKLEDQRKNKLLNIFLKNYE